jgi:adenylate kinase family enzyme
MKQGMSDCGHRISIVGTSGSGKTTLAHQVSQRLAIPYVELDALNWEPNWTKAPIHVFRLRAEQFISKDSWIVDGNYSKARTLVWGRANMVVWLDYSLPVIMGRLLRRTWQRVIRQEELWNGNRETWQKTFSSHSIFLWMLTEYRQSRKEYPLLFAQPEYAHLKVVHLRSPKATQAWLATLI